MSCGPRCIAILAVRNDAPYLSNCLRHLLSNGIDFAIIDNDSDDETEALVGSAEFQAGLVHYERLPFNGYTDLAAILRAKSDVAQHLDADWYLHLDADEIMHSYRPDETLQEAIGRVERMGANAVNFDEFVFLPIGESYVADSKVTQPLKYYYFFEPIPNRLNRAWKAGISATNLETGGHKLRGADVVLSSESFALRHYIFRSQEHALTKYANRKFPKEELEKGWHFNRVNIAPESLVFPSETDLEFLSDVDDRGLSKVRPRTRHYWQWNEPELPPSKPSLSRRLRRRMAKVLRS